MQQLLCPTSGRCSRGSDVRLDFFENSPNEVLSQFGKMILENLRDYLFDNLPDRSFIRHLAWTFMLDADSGRAL